VSASIAEFKETLAAIRALLARGADSKEFIPFVRVLAAWHGKVRVPVFNAGVRLYRATRYHTGLPTLKENLWFPPADRTPAGRANSSGRSVFYCSAHQSPALAEIEAGPYNIVAISEWVTQDRMIVQDLGFEEQALRRFAVDRRQPHHLEDVENASEMELEARRFISDAFLAEDEASYALTAAIAEVFSEGDAIAGIRYPSLALRGRSDNFALKPDYVRTRMRLEAATYYWLKSASEDGTYDFDPVADLSGIDNDGSLSWTYRDHVNVLPPGAALEVCLRPGRYPLQIPGPSEVVIDRRRYSVVPGAFVEVLEDRYILKLADETVIEGTDAPDFAEQPREGSTGGRSAAALAHDSNAYLKKFASVMAIAVRSREIASTSVSIAAAETLSNLELDKFPWTCQSAKQSAFEFHDPAYSAERIAWLTYLSAARASSLPLPTLLIVEGGIETLAAINARSEVLVDEPLPEGYTLACARATSDATDLIACRALGTCAEDATKLLDWILANPESLKQALPSDKHYSHMRVWTRTPLPEPPSHRGNA
jgi:hypothetical protein